MQLPQSNIPVSTLFRSILNSLLNFLSIVICLKITTRGSTIEVKSILILFIYKIKNALVSYYKTMYTKNHLAHLLFHEN